jgi:membrane protein required for colicin V production
MFGFSSGVPVDIIMAISFALAIARGWGKGFIMSLISLVATLIGLVAALKLAPKLAGWMYDLGIIKSGWGPLISFVILFLLIIWGVRWIAHRFENFAEALWLGMVNHILGALLQLLLSATVWSILLWLARRAYLLPAEMVATSRLYPYVEPIAPWVFAHIGAVIPLAKNAFSDLSHFFDRVNSGLPDRVGSHR